MVVFSSSASIIAPDIFLHLPPHVKLQEDVPMPDATAPQAHLPHNFRIRTALMNYNPSSLPLPLSTLAPTQLAVRISSRGRSRPPFPSLLHTLLRVRP